MADSAPRRPGGQVASRPLHFVWLIDGSGSMQAQGKMRALNDAIRTAIPALQLTARDYPEASVFMNAIRFGDEANWMVGRLTPLSEFHWQDIEAGGLTALGAALTMAGDALQEPLIRGRALPPILFLVTDGLPTDDFQAGLAHLLAKPWGKKSARLAVAIGEDGATTEAQEILRAFTSEESPPPLQADDPGTLVGTIRWAAVNALKSVCAPPLRRPADWTAPRLVPAPANLGEQTEW